MDRNSKPQINPITNPDKKSEWIRLFLTTAGEFFLAILLLSLPFYPGINLTVFDIKLLVNRTKLLSDEIIFCQEFLTYNEHNELLLLESRTNNTDISE